MEFLNFYFKKSYIKYYYFINYKIIDFIFLILKIIISNFLIYN